MRIEYQLSKEEFIAGLDSNIRRSGGKFSGVLSIAGCLLLAVVVLVGADSLFGRADVAEFLASKSTGEMLLLVLPALLLLAGVLVAIWYSTKSQARAKRSFNQMVRKKRVPQSYIGPHAIEIEGGMVTLTYGAAGRRYPCAEVDAEADRRHGGVLLFMEGGLLDVLPASAFTEPGSRDAFLEQFREARDLSCTETWGGRLEGHEDARAAARMTLEFNWDRDSYPEAANQANHIWFQSKLYWSAGRVAMTALALAAVCAAVFLCVVGAGSERSFLWFLGALAALLAACGLGYHPVLTAGNWNRQSAKNQILSGSLPRDALGPQLFCLTEEGVTVFRRESRHDLPWREIDGALSGEDGMVVLVAEGGRLLFLPGGAFSGDAQRKELLDCLNQGHLKEKETV